MFSQLVVKLKLRIKRNILGVSSSTLSAQYLAGIQFSNSSMR
ncbi:exported hypothetical protein [Vibrio coralliirubri]|nr:exported hypothetical protein [Vibrio coralliirubri]CDT98526.1 exported hypothetical protein [Vibrio coralliirubri]